MKTQVLYPNVPAVNTFTFYFNTETPSITKSITITAPRDGTLTGNFQNFWPGFITGDK